MLALEELKRYKEKNELLKHLLEEYEKKKIEERE